MERNGFRCIFTVAFLLFLGGNHLPNLLKATYCENTTKPYNSFSLHDPDLLITYCAFY